MWSVITTKHCNPLKYFTLHFHCIVLLAGFQIAPFARVTLLHLPVQRSPAVFFFFFFQLFTVELHVLFRLVIVFKLQLYCIVFESEFAMELLQFCV